LTFWFNSFYIVTTPVELVIKFRPDRQMQITENHIRHALARQIALIFDTSEQTVCNWRLRRNHPSGRLLQQASDRIGVPKDVLLRGLDLRAQDAERDEDIRLALDDELAKLLPTKAA